MAGIQPVPSRRWKGWRTQEPGLLRGLSTPTCGPQPIHGIVTSDKGNAWTAGEWNRLAGMGCWWWWWWQRKYCQFRGSSSVVLTDTSPHPLRMNADFCHMGKRKVSVSFFLTTNRASFGFGVDPHINKCVSALDRSKQRLKMQLKTFNGSS